MKIGRARTKPTAEPPVPAAGLAPPAGLSGVEARRRLIASGPNETAVPRTAGMLRQILSWLVDLLIVILLLLPICVGTEISGNSAFHTGIATQTLVLFVIRTAGNPLRSRPSFPLAITTLAVVAVAVLLPDTPAARALGSKRCRRPFSRFSSPWSARISSWWSS